MGSATTPPPASPHTDTRLRVRYAETDQMGVVYYSNYLVWMEIGRTDFCLEAGFRYSDMESETGIAIAVAEACCRYRAPARYDDDVLIRTTLERLRRRTLRFTYEIRNLGGSELLADGHTLHVAIRKRDGRPAALPDPYYTRLRHREQSGPGVGDPPERPDIP